MENQVRLSLVFSYRNRIYKEVLSGYVGRSVGASEIEQSAKAISDIAKLDDFRPVYESLRVVLATGAVISSRSAYNTAWMLAGNLSKLRRGEPVVPGLPQRDREWAPVQIEASCKQTKDNPDGRGITYGRLYRIRFLAGSPCPSYVLKWWSSKHIDYISSYLGFSKNMKKGGLIKRDGSELVSLRMYVLLDPDLSDSVPGFFHVKCPESMIRYNRAIIKKRRRIDFKCPRNYDIECFECPVGIQSCIASVHPFDYVALDSCPSCRSEGWMDPDDELPGHRYVCLRCRYK